MPRVCSLFALTLLLVSPLLVIATDIHVYGVGPTDVDGFYISKTTCSSSLLNGLTTTLHRIEGLGLYCLSTSI